MCGIAGVIGNCDRAIAKEAASQMAQSLVRRGPDGGGIKAWDKAVLSHRRLSIFDLSEAGRQPMVSSDGNTGVVFNGAIYNFLELRKELESNGHTFISHTDTEVLIQGYRRWGIDTLVMKLRGMFAFGIWDNALQKLYLVRDRLGIKPLVFHVHGGVIAFASTVRALRQARFVNELDERAIAEYLQLGFIPDDYSIYREAHKLPPASILEWEDGKIAIRRYWSSPPVSPSALSFEESVEMAEEQLLRSVERRLHADVPIGILLSGGIDSALICWASMKLGKRITAYTIGTPGDPWDETAEARNTAERLGLDHCVLDMGLNDQYDINDLVSAFAEPFACSSALGMLRVSKYVTSSSKVLLTGDGGDDVFLGYHRHRNALIADKLSRVIPYSLRKLWHADSSLVPRVGPLRRVATFFDYVAECPTIHGRSVTGLEIFGDRLNKVAVGCDTLAPSMTGSLIGRFLDHEYRNCFVGEYLTKVDGATMYYGLEARSPFLDQDLWEFASSLPYALRLHQWKLKAILREVARRRISPHLAQGRKRGFGIPVHRWIVGPWRPLVETVLRDSVLEREGWIRENASLELFQSALAQGQASLRLWYMLALELWMRFERSQVDTKPNLLA
ncbi:MAG: asparagine synthase (glutamine-hydrolyzing) [Nitrospira sp.]|nr:asparagine synthase (glutamine-hydrolyzing) [Nitrospira sp.]